MINSKQILAGALCLGAHVFAASSIPIAVKPSVVVGTDASIFSRK